MKKLNKILLFAAIPLLLCGGCSDNDNKVEYVESIKILQTDNDTIRLDKDEAYQVNIETYPSTKSVWYYTSDDNIFSVSKGGIITAKKGGFASLLVTAPQGELLTNAKCVIEVIEYVDSIATSTDGLVLAKDKTVDLNTLFTAYPVTASNRGLIYKSSDPSIVSIDEKGICKSVSKGIVEITATPADGKNDIVSKPIKLFSQYSPVALDRKDWTAVASSTQGYSVYNLFDGKTNTIWEAKYSEQPPFWILIDTHQLSEFHQVEFTQSSYREAKTIEVYTSPVTTDGITADDNSFKMIGSVIFNDNTNSRTLTLLPELQKSRYIKVVFLDSRSGNYISLAEINMFKVSE
ncbi:MAG: Ig-like domain-containing protein [Prevotella sp.]|jgi:hypothetical protein|nr:Ig-like domain-containing protein [Prevotella sp.]